MRVRLSSTAHADVGKNEQGTGGGAGNGARPEGQAVPPPSSLPSSHLTHIALKHAPHWPRKATSTALITESGISIYGEKPFSR